MFIPQRIILSIILCLGTINMCTQRMNLSIAILCMTNHSAITADKTQPYLALNNKSSLNKCSLNLANSEKNMNDGPFIWNRHIRGILLGIFFWGYFAGQVPAGLLIQKFSVRYVLFGSLLVLSFSTVLVPIAARTSIYFFYFLRICTGLASASWFPGFYQLWTVWAPPAERGLLMGFAYAGLHIGSAITLPITGALCQTSIGWSFVFYFFGGFSFIFCLIWILLVYDSPEKNPHISSKEREYLLLNNSFANLRQNKENSILPSKSMICSLPVWAFVSVNFGLDWNAYTFLTSAPTYMKEVLQFDFEKNAGLSALPYIGLWFGQVLTGWISDKLLSHKLLKLTAVRKLINSIGMFGAGSLIILITLFDCSYRYVVIGLLTTSLIFSGGIYSAGMLNPIEITPKHAGLLFAISNSLCALTGFAAPIVANVLTPQKSARQWSYVFFFGAGIYFTTGLFFLIFSSSVIQPWAIDKDWIPAESNNIRIPLTNDTITSENDENKIDEKQKKIHSQQINPILNE